MDIDLLYKYTTTTVNALVKLDHERRSLLSNAWALGAKTFDECHSLMHHGAQELGSMLLRACIAEGIWELISYGTCNEDLSC